MSNNLATLYLGGKDNVFEFKTKNVEISFLKM